MVSADDNEPQINPQAPEGAAEEGTATPPVETPSVPASPDDAAPVTPATTAAPEAADAAGNPTPETPAAEAPAAEAPAAAETAPESAPAETAAEAVTEAATEAPAEAASDADASSDAPADAAAEGAAPTAEGDQPAAEGAKDGEGEASAAEGKQGEGKDGEGAKRKRRPRGRRQGRGGQQQRGGRRRFQWDEVFLRQRLEILRAMEPDPKAIEWAVNAGGRFDVADILAGEGSSGREFGRRAYAATPETDDQAAWIILSAVRARDIVPIARQAVSGTTDQREQVKAAIEKVGIARVNPALQGERPSQQVFAERAQRVDLTTPDGEEQKAAWALLSLARPQDVKFAASPPRPRTGGPGGPGRPGGDRFGGDDRRGRRREPGIPGGKFSVGESGIGGELGAKLRAALEAAENNEVADTRDQKD